MSDTPRVKTPQPAPATLSGPSLAQAMQPAPWGPSRQSPRASIRRELGMELEQAARKALRR